MLVRHLFVCVKILNEQITVKNSLMTLLLTVKTVRKSQNVEFHMLLLRAIEMYMHTLVMNIGAQAWICSQTHSSLHTGTNTFTQIQIICKTQIIKRLLFVFITLKCQRP